MTSIEFPLLKRELVALLRTRRAFWLLVFCVTLSTLLPLVAWPGEHSAYYFAEQARAVFVIFALTQLSVVLLIIPSFTAGAISGERERDTYELLYTTLLSPFSIVVSKLLACVSYAVLVLVATVPSIAVLFLLGGIEFATVLECTAVTVAATLATGVVCLTVSMRSRRTAMAAVRAFVWTVFWNGGLLLLLALVIAAVPGLDDAIERATGGTEIPRAAFMAMTPYLAIGFALDPPFVFTTYPPWILSCAYSALVALPHFLYLLWRVRYPDLPGSRRAERRAARREGGRARRPARTLLTRLLLALENSGAPIVGNPIFTKEIRTEFGGRAWYRRLVFFCSLAVFLLIWGAGGWDAEMLFGVVFVTQIALVLLPPAVMVTSLTREYEQGNFDLLRGTLVPLRAVLSGKLWASIFAVLGVPVAALVSIGLAIAWTMTTGGRFPNFGRSDYAEWIPLRAVVCSGVLVLTLGFVISLASLFAVRFTRTLSAMLLTYLTLAGVFLGVPLLFGLMLMAAHGGDDGLVKFLSSLSPFIAMGAGLMAEADDGTPIVVLFAIWYTVGTVGCYAAAVRVLELLRERDR